MKASLVVAALAVALSTIPMDASAARYGGGGRWGGGHGGGWGGGGHWGGGGGYRGGGHWGGHGGYWGGHGHYYGGAWPYFGLGLAFGTGLGAGWGYPYPAYPAAPVYYDYPLPPPQACGSWLWDQGGYAWIWQPCAEPYPDVVVPNAAPPAPVAPAAPIAPMAPAPEVHPDVVPRG
jgi:hypothetical protein